MSEEEISQAEGQNYNLVCDMAQKLGMLKGYETGYSGPKKGKMIINKDGVNYLIDITPVGKGTLDEAMKIYGYWIR